MPDKITSVLSALENEALYLRQEIQSCINDHDFEFATHYQQALWRVERILDNIGNLIDKNYDARENIRRSINYFEKQINGEPGLSLRSGFSESPEWYYKSELEKLRQELLRLEYLPEQVHEERDGVFQQALTQLMSKQLTGFRLWLNRKDGLLLEFRYSRGALKMFLPRIKTLARNNNYFAYQLHKIIALGFSYTGDKRKLVLSITGTQNEIRQRLDILLSILLCEIFHVRYFRNNSFLEFL